MKFGNHSFTTDPMASDQMSSVLIPPPPGPFRGNLMRKNISIHSEVDFQPWQEAMARNLS